MTDISAPPDELGELGGISFPPVVILDSGCAMPSAGCVPASSRTLLVVDQFEELVWDGSPQRTRIVARAKTALPDKPPRASDRFPFPPIYMSRKFARRIVALHQTDWELTYASWHKRHEEATAHPRHLENRLSGSSVW